MEWYKHDESDRVKNVYSKYKLNDFWKWWSNGETRYMEIRIKDFQLLRDTATILKLPYSGSGIYINNVNDLKRVLQKTRDKATIWFGINPRKKNWTGKVNFKVFGGKDVFVDSIGFICCDIDRKIKKGPATKDDLKNADILANKILEKLSVHGWNKSYIKICSGHGIQLILKLDYSYKVPNTIFDSKSSIYLPDEDFEITKELIRKGIGAQIKKFTKNYENDLGVEVDTSVFNMGRVAALPVSKNFKYDMEVWRGIIDLKDDKNLGLIDYCCYYHENKPKFNKENIFAIKKSQQQDKLTSSNFNNHKLVKYMLEEDIPYGEINNKLWFQFKCLARDSDMKETDVALITFKRKLEQKFKGSMPLNFPDKNCKFDYNMINSFCINAGHPPLYPVWNKRTKFIDYGIADKNGNVILDWKDIKYLRGYKIIQLDSNTSILQDIDKLKSILNNDSEVENKNMFYRNRFYGFILGLIEKYGLEKTEYFWKHLLGKGISFD